MRVRLSIALAIAGCLLAAPVSARTRLVVLVPGMEQSSNTWTSLIKRLQSEVPGFGASETEWLFFDHGAGFYTLGRVNDYARMLEARIDAKWHQRPFDDVVLVGHSIGGLFVRQAYLLAANADPLNPGESEWAHHVSTIVLFAAVNRGIDDRSTWGRRTLASALQRVPHPRLLFEDTLQGSDFVANLRVNWIRKFGQLSSNAPRVTQLLGTNDTIVSVNDSRDLLAFPNQRPINIAYGTHGDLYRLDLKGIDPDERFAQIRRAFEPRDTDRLVIQADAANPVQHVVFVMHGIRASIDDAWVGRVREEIAKMGAPNTTLVVDPEYGYLTAARFAVPWQRRKDIRKFQDYYTEQLAEHPRAEFDFIGHSNGTYLLGESLKHIPGMRFTNVVLVGSVLPRDFGWDDLKQRTHQVVRVRNDMARWDWPVALLCSGLRGLGMRDVGTGGFFGFEGQAGVVTDASYYDGGHGAALENSSSVHQLVAFALGGPFEKVQLLETPGAFAIASRAMPYVVLLGAIALVIVLFRTMVVGRQIQWRRLAYLGAGMLFLWILLDVI